MSEHKTVAEGSPGIQVRCQREAWKDGVEIAVIEKHPTGRVMCAEPLTLRELTPGDYIEPTLRLSNQEAQFLMDELWRCGIKPSEGTGSAGSLAATERHLKDMQTIAMDLLRKGGATTGTELMMQCAPTIGDVALDLAEQLAYIAVARAMQTRDRTEHPMHGIAVNTDQWALAYQAKLAKLRGLLTPNAACTPNGA